MEPYANSDNLYTPGFSQMDLGSEPYTVLNLDLSDDDLKKMLVDDLRSNIDYWKQKPFQLDKTDEDAMRYMLGDHWDEQKFVVNANDPVDNRMFASVRAILSYSTAQLAKPLITPSRSDDAYVTMSRKMQAALYQHSLDEKVDAKVRAAVQSLVTRKRAYLKLRFDPNQGTYGDIVTEVCNAEDIVIDRYARFQQNPNKIYHRLRCSINELCAKFPEKEKEIKIAYGIQRGVYSQMSKYITYYECWFTYIDEKRVPREGVCWFIPEHSIILDKMPNPNWVYTGDDQEDKQVNVLFVPPKPFIAFNYINMGHSYIDETSLFEQAKPMQKVLNRKLKQILDNADYVNGRYIASKHAFSEEDGQKLVNKGPRTVALADADDVTKAFANIAGQALPPYVTNTILDARNEIDTMMGTPAVFRGEQPSSQDTLGRDLMVKQQAGALQDDLVRSIHTAMQSYYQVKLQMMRTYYTSDYWFQVRGGDGKFDFIMLNGENIDQNVKIGIQIDSTLPLDKEAIRANSLELAKLGRIDDLTLFEDMGMPDPEIRAERLMRSRIDPQGYMKSINRQMDNSDAEMDILLLIDGKEPEERDNYDQEYLDYFNQFMTTNRFKKLPQDAQERLVSFLTVVQDIANETANLQVRMLDQAGMTQPDQDMAMMGGAPGQPPSVPPGEPQAPPPAPPSV